LASFQFGGELAKEAYFYPAQPKFDPSNDPLALQNANTHHKYCPHEPFAT
jgi:hypothetical protein